MRKVSEAFRIFILLAVIGLSAMNCADNKIESNNVSINSIPKNNTITETPITKKTENNNTITLDKSIELNTISSTDIQDIIILDFNPNFILLKNDVYKSPNLQSERTWAFPLLTIIEVLEYGKHEKIDGEYIQWVKIRDNTQTGWCFNINIKQLKQPIKYNPMNGIDIEYLTLQNADKNERLKIEGKEGNYYIKYDMNEVIISFNKRDEYDDEIYYYGLGPETYRTMELCINNDITIFPSIYWGTHQRKNVINGITLVDTFMFSAHESQNQSIWRVLYFSTNKYDFTFYMRIHGTSNNNETIRQIMREAPNYFLLYHTEPYAGEDPRENEVVWDYKNKAKEQFGNDLREGINPSQTLKQWYDETEKILESLQIE